MKRPIGLLGLGLALLASACHEDVTPTDVSTRTTAMVQGNIVASTKAIATLQSGTTFQTLDAALTQLGTALSGLGAALGSPAPTIARPQIKALVTGPDLCLTTPSDPACLPDPKTPEEQAQRIADFLEQYVFTPENLDSADGSSATFRVPGSVVCKSADCSQDCTGTTCGPKVCVDTTPADCVTKVDQMQLRLRATPQNADGVRIDLLVGPDRANPLSVEGSPTTIALELDFGGLKAAYLYVADVLGGSTTQLPARFMGRIRAQLQTAGEQDVTLTASILTAIGIDLPLDVDGVSVGAMTFDVARADPAVMLHVNGSAKTVSFEVSVNAIDTSFPLGALAGAGFPASLVEKSHYAGLTAKATITEGDPVVKISHIGLGPGAMTVSLGDVVMYSYDLNPTLGRAFDLTITPSTTGDAATFAVTPGFDLSILWYYQALAPYLPAGATIPRWMADDTLRLQLTGETGGSVQPVPANAVTGFAGGLKVLTGTLSVSSRADQSTVTVPAGQCLVSKTPAADVNPIAGAVTVAPCP